MRACIAPHSGALRAFPTWCWRVLPWPTKSDCAVLEEGKGEELRRTPFALLDDPPEELRPKKAIRLDTPFKLPMRPRRGY